MKLVKKICRWFKREFIWLTSQKVLDAINSGASYEEVEAIVEEEMKR